MRYVELMDAMQFELAAEYLLMAAMLAEIKSRMLLPRSGDVDEDEEDPACQSRAPSAGVRALQKGC
jgi:segregation and condensation protein A